MGVAALPGGSSLLSKLGDNAVAGPSAPFRHKADLHHDVRWKERVEPRAKRREAEIAGEGM
jgi:hypothetical protein